MQVNETIDGFVSHVTDDGRLYCHLQGPGNDKLYEMQQELMTIYAQVNTCLISIVIKNYSEYMSSPTRLIVASKGARALIWLPIWTSTPTI